MFRSVVAALEEEYVNNPKIQAAALELGFSYLTLDVRRDETSIRQLRETVGAHRVLFATAADEATTAMCRTHLTQYGTIIRELLMGIQDEGKKVGVGRRC